MLSFRAEAAKWQTKFGVAGGDRGGAGPVLSGRKVFGTSAKA